MGKIIKESWGLMCKKKGYFFLGFLTLLLAIEITATVAIPMWRDYFFGGIEAKDQAIYVQGMWYFAGLMLAFVFSQGFKYYAIQKLALEWRTALNDMLVKRWRKAGMAKVDNPDQRIAEDTNIASVLALELVVETIISFSIILGLVGTMSSTLIYLSAGYTVAISAVAYFFHRPMVDREKLLQRAEADYRFTLAQCVNDGKRRPLKSKFNRVLKRYTSLINVTLGFSLFSRAKGNLMNLIPFALLIPMYFADEIGFGAVMKGVSQFDLLVINATILIILYPKVTKALASYERIQEFYEELT